MASTLQALAILAAVVFGLGPPKAATGGDAPTVAAAAAGGAAAEDAPKVTVRAVASNRSPAAGAQVAIAVVFDHAPNWHVHPNKPVIPKEWGDDFKAWATELKVVAGPGVKTGEIIWPPTHEAMVDLTGSGKPVAYQVYSGTAVAFVPVQVMPEAAQGPIEIEITAEYQACDDRQCLLPETKVLKVPLTIGPAVGTVAATGSSGLEAKDAALFKDFDWGVFGRADFGVVKKAERGAVQFGVFGYSFSVDSAGAGGLALMVLLAMLGGFLLNLTPCVLPVIPIKIMSLSHAAKNPAKTFMLGAIMSLGTIAFWLGIGGAIVGIKGFDQINTLFQTPWFSLGVGVFILVMGLGMLGLFTVQLPQAVYMVSPTHDSPGGSFLFGVMTAVLSTPCTAPFMGSAAAWATKQPAAITLMIFGAIGVGMAMPYLVLSARTKWLDRVPRSGPSSELVKQAMGIFMFAVAAFFVGTGLDPLTRAAVDPPMRWHWWVVAAMVAAAVGFTLVRGAKIKLRPATLGVLAVLGVAATAGAGLFAYEQNKKGPIDWVAYTPARFEEQVKKGNVVVMDFTAEWCLNCKALEAGVLHRPEVVKLLTGPGVTPMKVDLSGDNPDGQARLKSLNWVGIPLLAISGPGVSEPLKFDTYTAETVRAAIEKARGGKTGT
jgi:thiol:disulfide interchange protein DsbD